MTTPGSLTSLVAKNLAKAQSYGASIAVAGMASTGTITRGAAPFYDPDVNQVIGMAGDLIYSGPMNITEITGSSEIIIGDTPMRLGTMTATIPITANMPEVDDILQVTSAVDPALLASPYFRVTSVSRGGMVPVSRRLTLESLEASAARPLTSGVDAIA